MASLDSSNKVALGGNKFKKKSTISDFESLWKTTFVGDFTGTFLATLQGRLQVSGKCGGGGGRSGRGLWIRVPRGGSRISGNRGALKKFRRAERGAKNLGVFCVKNQDFMQKNHIFSNFKGGGGECRLSKAQSHICKGSLLDKAYCIYWIIEFQTFFVFVFCVERGVAIAPNTHPVLTAML